jgi:hypothetical protein
MISGKGVPLRLATLVPFLFALVPQSVTCTSPSPSARVRATIAIADQAHFITEFEKNDPRKAAAFMLETQALMQAYQEGTLDSAKASEIHAQWQTVYQIATPQEPALKPLYDHIDAFEKKANTPEGALTRYVGEQFLEWTLKSIGAEQGAAGLAGIPAIRATDESISSQLTVRNEMILRQDRVYDSYLGQLDKSASNVAIGRWYYAPIVLANVLSENDPKLRHIYEQAFDKWFGMDLAGLAAQRPADLSFVVDLLRNSPADAEIHMIQHIKQASQVAVDKLKETMPADVATRANRKRDIAPTYPTPTEQQQRDLKERINDVRYGGEFGGFIIGLLDPKAGRTVARLAEGTATLVQGASILTGALKGTTLQGLAAIGAGFSVFQSIGGDANAQLLDAISAISAQIRAMEDRLNARLDELAQGQRLIQQAVREGFDQLANNGYLTATRLGFLQAGIDGLVAQQVNVEAGAIREGLQFQLLNERIMDSRCDGLQLVEARLRVANALSCLSAAAKLGTEDATAVGQIEESRFASASRRTYWGTAVLAGSLRNWWWYDNGVLSTLAGMQNVVEQPAIISAHQWYASTERALSYFMPILQSSAVKQERAKDLFPLLSGSEFLRDLRDVGGYIDAKFRAISFDDSLVDRKSLVNACRRQVLGDNGLPRTEAIEEALQNLETFKYFCAKSMQPSMRGKRSIAISEILDDYERYATASMLHLGRLFEEFSATRSRDSSGPTLQSIASFGGGLDLWGAFSGSEAEPRPDTFNREYHVLSPCNPGTFQVETRFDPTLWHVVPSIAWAAEFADVGVVVPCYVLTGASGWQDSTPVPGTGNYVGKLKLTIRLDFRPFNGKQFTIGNVDYTSWDAIRPGMKGTNEEQLAVQEWEGKMPNHANHAPGACAKQVDTPGSACFVPEGQGAGEAGRHTAGQASAKILFDTEGMQTLRQLMLNVAAEKRRLISKAIVSLARNAILPMAGLAQPLDQRVQTDAINALPHAPDFSAAFREWYGAWLTLQTLVRLAGTSDLPRDGAFLESVRATEPIAVVETLLARTEGNIKIEQRKMLESVGESNVPSGKYSATPARRALYASLTGLIGRSVTISESLTAFAQSRHSALRGEPPMDVGDGLRALDIALDESLRISRVTAIRSESKVVDANGSAN